MAWVGGGPGGRGEWEAHWLWVGPAILFGPYSSCLSPSSADLLQVGPGQWAVSTLSPSPASLPFCLLPAHFPGVVLVSFQDSAQSSLRCLFFSGKPILSFLKNFMAVLYPYICLLPGYAYYYSYHTCLFTYGFSLLGCKLLVLFTFYP